MNLHDEIRRVCAVIAAENNREKLVPLFKRLHELLLQEQQQITDRIRDRVM